MHDLSHDGFYPLSRRHVDQYIPAAPGAFTLAVRLASGAHHTFFIAESEDLQESLRSIQEGALSAFPPFLQEYLGRFQCYLSYYVFQTPAHSAEIEKMLRQSDDPIAHLRVVSSN